MGCVRGRPTLSDNVKIAKAVRRLSRAICSSATRVCGNIVHAFRDHAAQRGGVLSGM